mgnify:CR=1 FL=1
MLLSQIFTFELKKQKPQYRYAVHGKEAVFTEAEFLFLVSLNFEIVSLNSIANRNELFLATS